MQEKRLCTVAAGLLYNLTDEAMRACNPSTQWVLATNGDNLYARDAFQTVVNAPTTSDVVALDYYSRYHRTTGPPCARFAASEGTPPCKENRCQRCACCQQLAVQHAWLVSHPARATTQPEAAVALSLTSAAVRCVSVTEVSMSEVLR